MGYLIYYIVYFILYNAYVRGLVELPKVEDNNIGSTEEIIRDTVNSLFAAFNLKNIKHNLKLKQYSTIHNFFISLTMKDSVNLNEIARLTRVNNIDNNTQYIITQVNELFDEGDISDAKLHDVFLNIHVDMFLERLRYLKMIHGLKDNFEVNPTILQILNNSQTFTTHVTKAYVLSNNEFWRPNARRIYKGERIGIKDYPFMASVQFFQKFQCSGSIIKSDLVITSSSCLQLAWNNRFYRENPAFLSVRVGSSFSQSTGEVIPVLEINFHPLYDPKTLHHNLAVMRLSRRIFFQTSSRVRKIDIDRDPRPLPNSDTGHIIIVGWGARDHTNYIHYPRRNRLAYDELNYYPLDECREVYKKDYVTKRHFCGGYMSTGGGACNFDAGGPGIIENVLMGIVSFGAVVCGEANSPTVFTKLGFYADWIDEIIDQQVPYTHRLPDSLTTYQMVQSLTTEATILTIQPLDRTTTLSPDIINIEDVNYSKLINDSSYFKDFMRTIFQMENITERPEATTKMPFTKKVHKTISKSTRKTELVRDIDIKVTSPLEDVSSESFKNKGNKKFKKKRKYNNKQVNKIQKEHLGSKSILKTGKKIQNKVHQNKKTHTKSVRNFSPAESFKNGSIQSVKVTSTFNDLADDAFYRRILKLYFD